MPKGITRSAWVPALARSIGWKPQRLRDLFNKKGFFAPFGDDDEKGLKILEDAKINTSKYRAAKGSAAATLPAQAKKKAKSKTGTGAKISAAFRRKLVRRLARLLPQGDTAYGHQKVRDILARNGMKKPWNNDKNEAQALEIFQKEGIPIDKFEYADASSAGQALVPASGLPSNVPASGLPANVPVKATAAMNDNDWAAFMDHYRDLVSRYKLSMTILKQYEKHFIKALKEDRFQTIADPLEEPISALNVMRAPPSRALPENVKALWVRITS